MNQIGNHFTSIEQVTQQYFQKDTVKQNIESSDISFDEILKEKIDGSYGLKFSKHAANRLLDRNIELTANQSQRLEEGAKKADSKGIRESLVLVDSFAFIVNVPNKTVVTAMDQTEANDKIFTNIDGAVIM